MTTRTFISTANGRELALKLAPVLGASPTISGLCGAICRRAAAYQRLSVAYLNRPLTAWEQDQIDNGLPASLAALLAELTRVTGHNLGLVLQGNPCGATVKIALPGELSRFHDDWSRDGVCVPTPRY